MDEGYQTYYLPAMRSITNKNFDNSISSTYQQKDTIIDYTVIRSEVLGHRESYSFDSDKFHKETPLLLVQPRQVELKCWQKAIWL